MTCHILSPENDPEEEVGLSLHVAQNFLRLFGVDLVKMKSLPSVSLLSFRHACILMLLQCSHICQKYVFMYLYSSWFNAHFMLLVTFRF